ncbi:MAG: iron-siderophore ABC transporter substrate-binding protein [Propionibacteriaceae bacterium]
MPRSIVARAALAVVLAGVVALSSCAADDPGPEESAAPQDGAGTFPVTVQHAFGETVVEQEPTKIISVGYASNDALLSLGIAPVAMTEAWGGDQEGVLPWNRDALNALGAETPVMLDATELEVEKIAGAAPDLILANYSGITEEEYATLSELAPTVAYPEQPWATPWRDVLTTTAEVTGKTAEAETLLSDLDGQIAAAAEEHPELKGKTVAAVWDTDEFWVYRPADSRVEFLSGFGLEDAPSVEELATGNSSFLYGLSREETDKLTSDILVFYAADQAEADAFLAKPYAQSMDQIKEGRYAAVIGTELVAAVSPPSVLSLSWGLDDYVAALSEGARGEGGS